MYEDGMILPNYSAKAPRSGDFLEHCGYIHTSGESSHPFIGCAHGG